MSFSVRGLTLRFGRRQTPILQNLSFDIPAGKVTAVLGMSGSGKTTLLNLLGLLLDLKRSTAGRIECRLDQETHDYAKLRRSARNRLRQKNFGFILQTAYMLPHFSCAQNVELPLTLRGEPARERRERLMHLVHRVDSRLETILPNRPTSVSGGERQRMAVLRAVIHDPHVVFADEPCAALDPVNAEAVTSLLLDWQRGVLAVGGATDPRERTLILVSHDLRTACRVADHFVLLRDGELVRGQMLSRSEMPGGPHAIDADEVARWIQPAAEEPHSPDPAEPMSLEQEVPGSPRTRAQRMER